MDHIEQTKLVSYQSYCAGTAGDHVVKMIGCVTTRDPCCLVSGMYITGVKNEPTMTSSYLNWYCKLENCHLLQ